jgi:hypothetical protein
VCSSDLPNQAKYAPFSAAINFIAAGILIFVILGVIAGALAYETWSALAGSTIWMKIIFDFILSRHAHLIGPKRKSDKSA